MKKAKEIASNEYIFSIITKILMVITGFVYSVFFARYLGPENKGSITYIQSIIGIGSIILSFGMHQAYPYYRKQNKDNCKFINEYMSSVIVLFSIFMVFVITISVFVWDNSNVLVSLLLMPLFGYNRISGYVMLVESPNKRNFSILLFSVIEMIYVIILYFAAPQSFILGVSALVLVELLKLVYFTKNIDFIFRVKYFNYKLLKELIQYGFFPMIALLMTTLNYRVDVLMLKHAASIQLSSVGVYSIGAALAEKALLIPDAVKEILLSKLAKGKQENEVAKVSRIAFAIALVVAVGIIAIGKPLIDIMYGKEYYGAYNVTAISIFGTVFMVFFKMIGQYNIVHKKQKLNVYFLCSSVGINILLNAVLIPQLGINGAAVATVIGHIVCAIIFLIYFSRISNIAISNIVRLQKDDILTIKHIFRKD